jgi:hypothetical protein
MAKFVKLSPESVIVTTQKDATLVTSTLKSAENTWLVSKRTADFSHLGLWPLECDSTSELVIQPNS